MTSPSTETGPDLILAVHTTGGPATVAVARFPWADDGVIVVKTAPHDVSAPARSWQQLVPLVEEGLVAAGSVGRHIARVGVSTGPGSFTGIKVGLAFAWGLARAHDAKLAGVCSLEVLALAGMDGDDPSPIRAVIAGVRDSVYTACYDSGPDGKLRCIDEPALLSDEEAKERLRAVDRMALDCSAVRKGAEARRAWTRRATDAGLALVEPTAAQQVRALARLAARAEAHPAREGAPVPVYLRRSWAEEALEGKR